MSLSLQQYLFSLMAEVSTDVGFLNVTVRSNFGDVVSTNNAVARTLAYIFISADIVLYAGIIAVIYALGSGYRKVDMVSLSVKLLRVSGVFLYASVLIHIVGFIVGFDFLSSYSLLLFTGSYTFNMFSQVLKILMLLILAGLYVLFPTILSTKMRILELPVLLQISAALCSTILSSTNFALLLLALEGFSLTLYIMTALGRNYGGVTASVKYFAFGTLGSVFLFWGVVHLYAIVPSLSFEVINVVLSRAHTEAPEISIALDFATTAIGFGFMLKLGAAPVHQWVADVYAGAHMYITAFFSIFVKFILFVVFMRVAAHFNSDALLNQFIIFSLVVGCFMSINQTEIKRLLAYSSIVHVAFLFMGDLTSSLVYLLTYATSSLVIFSVLLAMQLAGKEIIYLNDLRFLRGSGYYNLGCLTVALASSAGLPPFAGFYGKFLVWSSLIEDIYLSNSMDSYIILFLSISISLVTIFYYMRVIAYLFIGDDEQSRSTASAVDNVVTFNTINVVQWLVGTLLIFWTFLQPYLLPVLQFMALSI